MSVAQDIITAAQEEIAKYQDYFSIDDFLYAWDDQYTELENKVMGETRWGIIENLVISISAENTFLCFEIDRGKTEYQDYLHLTDVFEVEQQEKVIIDWKRKVK